jgi:hypothetical protein
LATSGVHLRWDPAIERPTLGGLLVLRQEAEILAQIEGCREVWVHISENSPLVEKIFGHSKLSFHLTTEPAPANSWPVQSDPLAPFSYFSFSRLLELWQTFAVKPRLAWSDAATQKARTCRRQFSGKLICVHLRNLPPFGIEESNADGASWMEFFRKYSRPGSMQFVLLGDDSLPTGMQLTTGVTRAVDQNVDLSTQLALIAQADAFLGMASGICTAANFSDTPHVIFKHPAHHQQQMIKELGDKNRFPFAASNQQLWRRLATVEALSEAMELIV